MACTIQLKNRFFSPEFQLPSEIKILSRICLVIKVLIQLLKSNILFYLNRNVIPGCRPEYMERLVDSYWVVCHPDYLPYTVKDALRQHRVQLTTSNLSCAFVSQNQMMFDFLRTVKQSEILIGLSMGSETERNINWTFYGQ